jgi:hypothetical protein
VTHLGLECTQCYVGEFVAIPNEWESLEPTQVVFNLLLSDFEFDRVLAGEFLDFNEQHMGHDTRVVLVRFEEEM